MNPSDYFWFEPTDDQRAGWPQWLKDHPEVREIAKRFEPWRMYRLTTTGQVCMVLSFSEDGTMRIYAEHPGLGSISGRNVFGINPDDLVLWTENDENSVDYEDGFGTIEP